jgi:hypothetical protein
MKKIIIWIIISILSFNITYAVDPFSNRPWYWFPIMFIVFILLPIWFIILSFYIIYKLYKKEKINISIKILNIIILIFLVYFKYSSHF